MKTQVYKIYSDFLNRENKNENGVSVGFAAANPNWQIENEENEASWNCSRCSRCSGCSNCSDCFDCSHCSHCFGCFGCSGCSDCFGCSDCSDCFGCSDCSRCFGCFDCSRCSDCSHCFGCSDCSHCFGCSGCSGCSGSATVQGAIEIPTVENIHAKVLAAVNDGKNLKMDSWHHCKTTHCRGGHVIAIAGPAGLKLEAQTSSEFAAMAIYNKSSPVKVSPVRFYESDEKAMEDIRRCAAEEAKLAK